MNIKKIPLAVAGISMLFVFGSSLHGQTKVKSKMVSNFPAEIRDLKFANIPGAPKLHDPQLINGRTKPVLAEGMDSRLFGILLMLIKTEKKIC